MSFSSNSNIYRHQSRPPLHSLDSGEQAAIDGIDDWEGRDLATTKKTAIKTLDGLLAAGYLVKFDVDVSLGAGVDGNVHYVSVFSFTFFSNVFFKIFGPGITRFPKVAVLAMCCIKWVGGRTQ